MKLKTFSGIFLLFFIFLRPVLAENLEDKVILHMLPNGMKFLLVKRIGAPVFAAYLRVKVGGADEKEGKSGIAHMLEHMAFKGTQKIGTKNYIEEKKVLDEIETVGVELAKVTRAGEGSSPRAVELQKRLKDLQEKADRYVVKDEFSRAFNKNGASDFNATTSKDVTSYFVVMPSSKLRLWAYLDSERLRDPVFREFYQERDVVQEEQRSRVEDSPFGKNYENLLLSAFAASPYKVPTIGYVKDIKTLTATDLKEFYKIYYVPQNIVGAVVGDIDLDETRRLLDQTFGRIPAGSNPPVLNVQEPPQKEEKRTAVSFEARPQIMLAYHKPTLPARDDYVFDLIGQILCEGRTSRLHQALIERQRIAQTVECDTGTPGARLDNLFFVYAAALGSSSPAQLEKSIEAEIERLKSSLVTEEELERARNQLISDRIFKMQSNLGLAEDLTYFESVAGDWRYMLKHEQVVKSVTAEELREVARKYLVKNNRTISILSKAGTGGAK
jgi:predicted Zn-dependent peptidase